jgi:RHS repeat-associated protein
VDYDANGNITALSRNGFKSNNTFGLIDNLNYTYNSNSNKILKVEDASNETASFKDVSGNDYEYWLDGSLKKDNNKEITQIDYNYLKLPEQITLTGGRWIKYDYDASGGKLKKTLSTGQVNDYEEDDIYTDGVLYQTSHDEGRIANGIFEYNITDHNNDLRVSFRDSLGIAVPVQSIFYDPWGLSMKGMQVTRNPLNFNKYQFLNRETQFETGYIDLINRQFDPQIGRFTSTDPVTEGQEHLSLYQYGWNNPVLKSDPNGNCPDCNEEDGLSMGLKGWHEDFGRGMDNLWGIGLSLTDANDAAVLVTSITRGSNAINFDGTKATGVDKGFALLGVALPLVSGGALKKGGSELIEYIGERAVGAYKSLQGKFNEAHHIIQDAAVKDIAGYNKRNAPTIHLEGSSKVKGTEHNLATEAQNSRRKVGDGGTYGSERKIAYRSLRAAGLSRSNAKAAVRKADSYFFDLGVTISTQTRIPYKRP